MVTAVPDGASHVIVNVSDNGLGMNEEQRLRLFQPYERLERYATRNIPGTGLGLYLVKHLVELHRGTVTCQTAPDHGSVFTVRLPTQAQVA